MRVIFATCSPGEAETLVDALLAERLIACANLVPGVRSHYWWEGEICREEETFLVMETSEALVAEATERLRALHSYDVPKIVVVSPESCDDDYREWLRGVVRQS